MDIRHNFFSYRGRLGRGAYFACNVVIYLLGLPFRLAQAYADSNALPGLSLAAGLTSLFIVWPATAVIVKRGHDRNRPAWFSIGLFIAVTTALTVAQTMRSPMAIAAVFGLGLYQLVEYLILPASAKAKRYDLRPTGGASAEVFL